MQKKCCICKESKPLEDFAINRSKIDGRTNTCRQCKSEYNKQYYVKTKHIHNPNRAITRKKAVAELGKEIMDMKESTPCTDCGNYYKFWQMDFDHLRDKKFDVSKAMALSRTTVMKEIAKCELVCANCHRTRTYLRLSGRMD